MGRTKVEVTCVVCEQPFLRDQYEVKRNARLGRANCCSRSCQAKHMNQSDKAREWKSNYNTANFQGDGNPNWKGGVSAKGKK